MGKRKSLIKQGVDKLLSMAAFGQSKHEDKKQNGGHPAMDKIYGSGTMDNYIDAVSRFLRWAQDRYKCRYLEEAREYVAEYLSDRIDTMSAWTVRMEAAAIAKLYQIRMDELGVELPERKREDIVQHRDQKWIGHFSPENHKDLVAFSQSSGVRRHELAKACPDDVCDENGKAFVETIGKGGKHRKIPCLNAEPLRIAMEAKAMGKERIFDHVPKYAPIHEYRAQYAQTMYDMLARSVEEIPQEDRYVCRGAKKGIVYDKKALAQVSKALGHNRLDVVADNYLYEKE